VSRPRSRYQNTGDMEGAEPVYGGPSLGPMESPRTGRLRVRHTAGQKTGPAAFDPPAGPEADILQRPSSLGQPRPQV
jgi:hypothetical protein